MNKKSKLILMLAILLAFAIIIFLIINIFNKKEQKNNKVIGTVEISQAIENDEIEDFEKNKIKDVIVASKYIVEEAYKLNARSNFDEISGEIIYIRNIYNKLNIFQTTYQINKYENINSQIYEYMKEFERICAQYMGTEVNESEGILYGESERETRIPLEESIYYEERLYSKTYKIKEYNEEKTYDINFYKQDNKLVAEFVKVL